MHCQREMFRFGVAMLIVRWLFGNSLPVLAEHSKA
jgi:hypothetical protein